MKNYFHINNKTAQTIVKELDDLIAQLQDLNVLELATLMADWSVKTVAETETMDYDELIPRAFLAECIRRLINTTNAVNGDPGRSRTTTQTTETKYD